MIMTHVSTALAVVVLLLGWILTEALKNQLKCPDITRLNLLSTLAANG